MRHISRREVIYLAAAAGAVGVVALSKGADKPAGEGITKLTFVFELSRIDLEITRGELVIEKGVALEPTESSIKDLEVARKRIRLNFLQEGGGKAKLHVSIVTGSGPQGGVMITDFAAKNDKGKLQIFQEGKAKAILDLTGTMKLNDESVLNFAPQG